MRKRILIEEPLCRECLKRDRVTATTIADHIIPKAEGGTDDRENYQGLCDPCSSAKTAAEAARAQGRPAPRQTVQIGADGWPREA
jgi:5-methylcytosine-specific restriction protein A